MSVSFPIRASSDLDIVATLPSTCVLSLFMQENPPPPSIMTTPVVPKRPRGRPRKDGRLSLPGLVAYETNTLADPWMTLRYNPSKKCLCTYKSGVGIGDSLCPYHGIHDDKSKSSSRKEAAPAQFPNKRKRDDDQDREAQDHTLRLSPTLATTDQRRGVRSMSLEMITEESFNAELCRLKERAQRLLDDESPSDQPPNASPNTERGPLREIDFLQAPLDARKLIYSYLLVPSSRTITFPKQQSTHTFSELNPELQANILFAHPLVYKECRPILYGENNFVAQSAGDFFLPTGIQGLRPATARRIKHISIIRKGSANECDISSQKLAASLHSMVLQSPAFLGLRTITIRFEVSRPAHLNLFTLQTFLQGHNVTADARAMYKKAKMVKDAAATVAFKALRKGSPFQGLCLVEESERTVWAPEGGGSRIVDVNEVCLFRTCDAGVEYQEDRQTLRRAILDALLDEKLHDVPGADGRFTWFCRKCPS
ncbi:hypothetical protein PV04_04599 [Phialophora macrospora]|uniref:Uncharacterized protein n=1 Tax=Phialophora macrospora TaxID=1851006 RepID=A0A0D2E2V8_9EURO|nr:hypothetical protein PV04_04599 [Phialophora macrospora]